MSDPVGMRNKQQSTPPSVCLALYLKYCLCRPLVGWAALPCSSPLLFMNSPNKTVTAIPPPQTLNAFWSSYSHENILFIVCNKISHLAMLCKGHMVDNKFSFPTAEFGGKENKTLPYTYMYHGHKSFQSHTCTTGNVSALAFHGKVQPTSYAMPEYTRQN